jgi:hypothetical protein
MVFGKTPTSGKEPSRMRFSVILSALAAGIGISSAHAAKPDELV